MAGRRRVGPRAAVSHGLAQHDPRRTAGTGPPRRLRARSFRSLRPALTVLKRRERPAPDPSRRVHECLAARSRDQDAVRDALGVAVHARRTARGRDRGRGESAGLGDRRHPDASRRKPGFATDAEDVTRHYLQVLDQIHAARLDAHISVKPTQLGLDFDPAFCSRNLQRLIDRAAAHGTFVWMDMESTPYVDATLTLFRQARIERLSSASRCRRICFGPNRTSPDSCRRCGASARQRCLSRVAAGRVSEEAGCRCEFLPAGVPDSGPAPAPWLAAPYRHARCPADRPLSGRHRSAPVPPGPMNTRCCTASRSHCSGGWSRRGTGCGC